MNRASYSGSWGPGLLSFGLLWAKSQTCRNSWCRGLGPYKGFARELWSRDVAELKDKDDRAGPRDRSWYRALSRSSLLPGPCVRKGALESLSTAL